MFYIKGGNCVVHHVPTNQTVCCEAVCVCVCVCVCCKRFHTLNLSIVECVHVFLCVHCVYVYVYAVLEINSRYMYLWRLVIHYGDVLLITK